jgi:hypothetical protein
VTQHSVGREVKPFERIIVGTRRVNQGKGERGFHKKSSTSDNSIIKGKRTSAFGQQQEEIQVQDVRFTSALSALLT